MSYCRTGPFQAEKLGDSHFRMSNRKAKISREVKSQYGVKCNTERYAICLGRQVAIDMELLSPKEGETLLVDFDSMDPKHFIGLMKIDTKWRRNLAGVLYKKTFAVRQDEDITLDDEVEYPEKPIDILASRQQSKWVYRDSDDESKRERRGSDRRSISKSRSRDKSPKSDRSKKGQSKSPKSRSRSRSPQSNQYKKGRSRSPRSKSRSSHDKKPIVQDDAPSSDEDK